MKNLKKIVLFSTVGLSLCLSLLTVSSSIASGTGTGTGTGGGGGGTGTGGGGGETGTGVFDHEVPKEVWCLESKTVSITYYDFDGRVVGSAYAVNGVFKTSYNGSYASKKVVEGGVAAHWATMKECEGGGLYCQRLTAAEACL